MLLVSAAALAWALAGAAGAGAARKGTLVSGRISFDQRACAGDHHPREVPLSGVTLVLDRAGNPIPVRVSLDAKGRFSARVSGHGPIDAELLLEDRDHLVKVIPAGSSGDVYRVGTWIDPGRNKPFVAAGRGSDAVNVFLVALRAARYVRSHHIKVPEVTIVVHSAAPPNDDIPGGYYVSPAKTIHIYSWEGHPGYEDAWEPYVIDHEYGHHVLESTAPPPSNPGGRHTLSGTYPSKPALAYSEGFATALAGLVLGTGDLGTSCRRYIHLAWVPAQPLADKPVFAQFNETAAGAVMWREMRSIGPHDFVNDMVSYKDYAGHFPDDMRQVREALVPAEHGSAAKHLAIDKVFGQQNLRWGMLASLTHEPIWDGTGHGTDMYYEVHLTLSGPYGSCEINAKPGSYDSDPSGDPRDPFVPKRPTLVAYQPSPQYSWDSELPGALPYTWQDECLMNTADGSINPQTGPISVGTGGVPATGYSVPGAELLFPYLAGAAQHNAEFTLSAEFVCVAPATTDDPGEGHEPGDPQEQETCGPGAFTLEVDNGIVKDLSDKVVTNHYGPAGPANELRNANYWTAKRIELPYNQEEALVRWSANGDCKVLFTGEDCSTALIVR